MDNPRYSAPEGASGMSPRRRNAGSVTEKAAATTQYIRQRAGSLMGKVHAADQGLHDAEERLQHSEKYLEKVLYQMEEMIYAGREMANQARRWLEQHPEYEKPVRNLSARMEQMRDEVSEGMEDPRTYAREHPLPTILAGGAILGLVVAGAAMAQRYQSQH